MNKLLFKPLIIRGILFLGTFVIYLHHLSPGVYGGDTGDYLSAIAVRGVVHPSGYPLYTMLGIFMSLLPIPQTLAWKVGLLSAIFSSLSVVTMYLIVHKLLKNTLVAIITSLTLAFVFPFWLFAEVAEVFALHSFFLLLLFYLAVSFYQEKRIKNLYLISFFLGLSFTNHELTLLIVPSLLILIFSAIKKTKISLKTIFTCIGLFLLGLLPYVYIPIAASFHPQINWDNASTLQNFLALVTRREYGWTGVGGGLTSSLKYLSLQEYLSYIISPRGIAILGFAFFGIAGLFRKKKYALLFAILCAFVFFGPFFAYYWGGFDTDNQGLGIFEKFFTASILFLILLVPYGITYISGFIRRTMVKIGYHKKTGQLAEKIIISLAVFIPVSLFIANFLTTDLHTLWMGNTFGKDLLTQLPKNSYLVEDTDDTIFFTTRYMQFAYGIRQDVTVVSTSDFQRFIKGTRPIGDKNKPQGTQLQGNYVVGITNPIFNVVSDYNDLTPSEQATAIPYGLLFLRPSSSDKPLSEEAYLQLQQPLLTQLEKSFQTFPPLNSLSELRLVADIPTWYARAFANTGAYLIRKYQDFELAKKYFQKALSINPNLDLAYEGLGDVAYLQKDCKAAKKYYETATDYGFLTKRYYIKLYVVVDSCLHDKVGTQQLRDYFSSHSSFFGNIVPNKK